MILQALYDYYQRKADDPESGIAPEGWEWKEIPFLVVIDKDGNFKTFQDMREGRRAHRFLVPTLGEKKGNGIKANFLWENIEYLFGISVPTKNKPTPDLERIKIQHNAFKEKVETLLGSTDSISALKNFVKKDHQSVVEKDPQWDTVKLINQSLLLAFEGLGSVTPVTDLPDIRTSVNNSRTGKGSMQKACLITGEKDEIVRLESAIKGVRGTDGKAERSFISFNQTAFCSYKKEKNYNAPVGKSASFAYTTALNMLLGKDSNNKILISDATVVFWAEKQSETYNIEADFPWYFRTEKDDPEKGTQAVKNLYDALHTGKLPLNEGNRFYVLGLAPNAARISVRFWKTGTVKNFAEKIKQHFDDFSIVHGPKEPEHLALTQILSATALEYKMDNVPPNLAGAVVTSILDGTPYPQTLLQQCVRRIRAKQEVNRARAAILKACINRFNRFYNQDEKEVLVGLDRTNINTGYRIGRLFAVLEKIQEEASPGINTTIRDRFYGAASATPITVFPQLLKLKNHHLPKIPNPGRRVNLEKEIQEIFDAITMFPSHLSLDQQSLFAIGYYHQRQDFFTKKDTDNK